MKVRLYALVAVGLAAGAAVGRAQPPATVELRHRSAEAVITVLRPVAAPATLSGAGTLVQIRAAPSDLERVRGLVREADRPLRPLRVVLSDAPQPADSPEPVQPHGSVTLSTARPLPADAYGNGQVLSTRASTDRQAVEVLEGEPLAISMPAPQSLWFGVAGKAAAAGSGHTKDSAAATVPAVGGVVHFDAVSDFTARIWLAGPAVAIDLQPRAAGRVEAGSPPDPGPGTVYGQVGQWIALVDPGTELQSPVPSGSGAAGAGLWIRVELAPQAPGSR